MKTIKERVDSYAEAKWDDTENLIEGKELSNLTSDLREAVEGKRDYWKKQVDVHVDKNREMLAYDMCSRVIAANSILTLLDELEK